MSDDHETKESIEHGYTVIRRPGRIDVYDSEGELESVLPAEYSSWSAEQLTSLIEERHRAREAGIEIGRRLAFAELRRLIGIL